MMPTTRELDGIDPEWSRILTDLTRDAGFTVLRLDDAFGDAERIRVELAPWDQHPSVLGHQLMARRLYRAIWEHPDLFKLNPASMAAH
jgi:hypothetical protein